MSDRLAELRRQRELVQQHLAWLDREIAAEAAKQNPAQTAAALAAAVAATTPKISPAPLAQSAADVSATPPAAAQANPDADRILEEFRVSPSALHHDVKKGCFLYFAAALALFFAIVALLYIALSRR
jgi:hypothetical protein